MIKKGTRGGLRGEKNTKTHLLPSCLFQKTSLSLLSLSLSQLLAAEVDFLSFFLSLPCLFLLTLPTHRPQTPLFPRSSSSSFRDVHLAPGSKAAPDRPATLGLCKGALEPGARPGAAHGRGTRHADGAPGGALAPSTRTPCTGGQWLMYPYKALPVTAMILTALLLLVFSVLFLELVFLTAECFTSCPHVVTHCFSPSSSSSSYLFSPFRVPCFSRVQIHPRDQHDVPQVPGKENRLR